MRKFIIALAILAGGVSANAQTRKTVNDTVTVNTSYVQKIILDESVSHDGKRRTKYYVLYKNELIPTSKNVTDAYRLCKKYNAKCALAMVISGKTHKKRIILN